MIRRTLTVATALILVGCGSSNSDGGAGGAASAGAGKSGAPTDSAGATSGGSSNAGQANAGQANAGQANAGQANAGQANAGQANAGQASVGGASAGGGAMASGGAVSGGGGDLPPLDPSADAGKLNDSDKGVLCDWVNDKLGGYGAMFDCTTKTVMNHPSQALCISGFLNFQCEVTVQDVTTCTIARVPSHACNAEFDTCHRLFCQ